MSKARLLFLTVIALIIIGLCVLTASKGHSELIVYYVIGLVLLIAMEVIRIVLAHKKS